jgi:hypothetical protein
MIELIRGATETVVLNVSDELQNLTDLTLAEPINWEIYREFDREVVLLTGTATVDPDNAMQALCLIDTTTLPSGRLELYAELTAAPDQPILGPFLMKIEGGTQAGIPDSVYYQVRAEKAQPNGYASLDSSGLVPIAQVPSVQGPQGPQGEPGGGGKIFYLNATDNSDIAGYKKASETPSANPESSIATVVSGTGDVPIASFITDPGSPGAVPVPAGVSHRWFYAKVSSSTGVARLHFQLVRRDQAGVETVVRDEFSPNFSNTDITLISWNFTASSGVTLVATDRLVIKLSVDRVSGPASFTVTTYFEGVTHVAHIETTITTNTWKGPIDTFANLPTTGNAAGDVRIVLDRIGSGQSALFAWSGSQWQAV